MSMATIQNRKGVKTIQVNGAIGGKKLAYAEDATFGGDTEVSEEYFIQGKTLTGIAEALQEARGESQSYAPAQMQEAIESIHDSATYLLIDEYGNQYPAVYGGDEVVFDATADDIRLGKVAATASGVTVGTAEILPANARVYYVGTASSIFNTAALDSESSAVGVLSE